MKKPLIHIGMMKAGSTTLQENVFARHSQMHNIWKPTYAEILRQSINLEDHELQVEDIQGFIKKARSAAHEADKVLVASNEQITGLPTLSLAARRVKEFFPDAKILFIIREQAALIRSYYLYQCRRLGGIPGVPARYADLPVTFEEFTNWHLPPDMNEAGHKTQKFFQLAWRLKYASTIELYEKLFGKENVLVLPIEMTTQDPSLFAKRLGQFAEVDEKELQQLVVAPKKHESPNEQDLVYERWRQKLPKIEFSKFIPFASQIRNAIKSYAKNHALPTVVITDEIRQQLYTLYAEQNSLIAKNYDLDLECYGYIMAEQKQARAS